MLIWSILSELFLEPRQDVYHPGELFPKNNIALHGQVKSVQLNYKSNRRVETQKTVLISFGPNGSTWNLLPGLQIFA